MKFLPFIITLIVYSHGAIAQTLPGIEVSGKGSVKVMPDHFTLSVQIKERGTVAQKIKMVVDNKSEKIVKMLKKQGLKDRQIESSQLNLYPFYQEPSIALNNTYTRSNDNNIHTLKNNRKKVSLFFDVSRTIKVSFDDASHYDKILDSMIKLGITNVSPLQKSVANSDLYYKKALALAIQNANTKAIEIAKQLEVELGAVVNFKESSYHAPVSYRMSAEAGQNFQSHMGEQTISAQVMATFAIKH